MKKYILWLLIPLIVLAFVGCDQLPTAEESAQKTVYVGPEKVDCVGEGPQTCYLIKENPDDQWSLWYDEIEGFDYEPGNEYELLVSEEQVENPPAGGSSLSWTVDEVVNKTAVDESDAGETSAIAEPAEEEAAAEEEAIEEAPPAEMEFLPIAVEEMGVSTVAPASWPKIEDDPLLKDAWGPGQYRFVAFHSVTGDDVQDAMAQLLNTTVADLEAGTIDGEYWEEEIGSYQWALYIIENPDVGLVQTVSMTEQDGAIYIVSLFIESKQKDDILIPVLENFVIEEKLEEETPEEEMVDEVVDSESAALIDTKWVLTAYDDGSGQLVDVPSEVEITALFSEDERVAGSAGCNDYVSLYTLEGDSLSISLPAMTRKECIEPPGIMVFETGFLGNLSTAASYQISGDELNLLDEGGNVNLTFTAA